MDSSNEGFIPGIYNYCDRWCERCAFTQRCRTYARDQDLFGDDGPPEIGTDAFLEVLSGTLQDSLDLLREVIKEEGIDLDSPEDEEWAGGREEDQEAADNHPLSLAAEAYIGMVNDWFAAVAGPRLEEMTDREIVASLGPPQDSRLEEVIDALEVIRWHQMLIAVKLHSAVYGRLRDSREPQIWEEGSRHSDGTAKVCLLIIDQSIGAWGTLLRAFPARKSATLHLIGHLSGLRLDVEREFPDAWAFVRPGFDETT